jgi:hypothetical protein
MFMKKSFKAVIVLLLVISLLAGCQQTPDNPIVIEKDNDGWQDYAASEESIPPTDVPSKYTADLSLDRLDVTIDANVEIPEESIFPIYLVRQRLFTQEDADRIMSVLLGDAELYAETNVRTKEFLQQSIDSYAKQLQDEVSDDSREFYQEQIKALMAEQESAPDNSTLTPASRTLEFIPTDDLLGSYGEETDDAPLAWTEEAKHRAEADGNTAITGISFLPAGKMRLSILNNTETGSSVRFLFANDEDLVNTETLASFSEDEAKQRARAYLKEMGVEEADVLDCSAEKNEDGKVSSYAVSLCSHISGTEQKDITPASVYDAIYEQQTAPSVKQENIIFELSDAGIIGFTWSDPYETIEKSSNNMKLLSFEDIEQMIESLLPMKTLWAYPGEEQDENIIGRKLTIDKISLSYMQVRKKSDMQSRYYIPVWDVIGSMTYQYSDTYDPSGGGFVVDKNGERIGFEDCSVLTINAIDGTVIDRLLGY